MFACDWLMIDCRGLLPVYHGSITTQLGSLLSQPWFGEFSNQVLTLQFHFWLVKGLSDPEFPWIRRGFLQFLHGILGYTIFLFETDHIFSSQVSTGTCEANYRFQCLRSGPLPIWSMAVPMSSERTWLISGFQQASRPSLQSRTDLPQPPPPSPSEMSWKRCARRGATSECIGDGLRTSKSCVNRLLEWFFIPPECTHGCFRWFLNMFWCPFVWPGDFIRWRSIPFSPGRSLTTLGCDFCRLADVRTSHAPPAARRGGATVPWNIYI